MRDVHSSVRVSGCVSLRFFFFFFKKPIKLTIFIYLFIYHLFLDVSLPLNYGKLYELSTSESFVVFVLCLSCVLKKIKIKIPSGRKKKGDAERFIEPSFNRRFHGNTTVSG